MKVVSSIADLRQSRPKLNGRVGLVTTMGFLHEGHMSLVHYACEENDSVMATIFVNPTQFGQGEDLDSYPRDLPRDLAMLEAAGVDLVFTPSPDSMYPSDFQTTVEVRHVAQGLEGAHRPGHFQGVATIVAKLFNLAQADVAYFGQKDAQQVVVIKQMARDLNFPPEIAVCPIVREPDGLALSSRNVYLTSEERQAATILYNSIQEAGAIYDGGERHPEALRQCAQQLVEAETLVQLEYVSLADPRTLSELHQPTDAPVLLSLTVQVGKPRLLDNCLLPLSLNNRADASDILGGFNAVSTDF